MARGDQIDTTYDPRVKMAMAKALWNLNYSNKAKGKEVLLAYLKSTDEDLRAEGALALGEIGAAVRGAADPGRAARRADGARTQRGLPPEDAQPRAGGGAGARA